MKDYFADHRFTIEYAKGHILEADELAKAFFASEPYERVTKADPSNPGYRLQLLRLSEPLPPRISALASDAAKNLRSVLDHIGYAVAVASGQKGNKAYFPFGDSLEQAASRYAGDSRQIPKEVFDLMMIFRPYQGGDDALWALNKLANTNKHESLVRVVLFAENLQFEGQGIWLDVGKRETVNDHLLLAWIRPGDPIPNHKITVTPSIRFNRFKGITLDEYPFGFLSRVAGTVERILMAVERESRSLGIIPSR